VKFWFLLAAIPFLSFGQDNDPCTDLTLERNWTGSPVYVEAEQVARMLRSGGIEVQCIRRSKEERLFDGQLGAAWFKTNQGAFEVWFLPKMESFNRLQIKEHAEENGRYVYTMGGAPNIKTTIDSSRRIEFIRQGNILIEVWGNSKLAARIRKALGPTL
jgi:hypothetical protein